MVVDKFTIAIILVLIVFLYLDSRKKELFEEKKVDIIGDATALYGFLKSAVTNQVDKIKKDQSESQPAVATPVEKVGPDAEPST